MDAWTAAGGEGVGRPEVREMSAQGWIGIDLDGTLAYYDKWRGAEHIGAPVPAMAERMRRWVVDEGRNVRIFTARVSGPADEAEAVRKAITAWLAKNALPLVEITNIKDYQMIELWDDRAIQVVSNTGEPVGQSTRGLL